MLTTSQLPGRVNHVFYFLYSDALTLTSEVLLSLERLPVPGLANNWIGTSPREHTFQIGTSQSRAHTPTTSFFRLHLPLSPQGS